MLQYSFEAVLRMIEELSGKCLEVVWKVSGRCLKGSGGGLEGVWRGSERGLGDFQGSFKVFQGSLKGI